MNTDTSQKNKSVLITGAADRIGLELAKECLDMGYHTVIHYRTSAEPAQSIFNSDKRVTFIQAELTESPEKFMDDARNLSIPPLVGLVNNAAIFQRGDMSDPNHFSDMLAVNALTPLKLSAEFAKSAKNGWIINISDAHTRPKSKNYQNYRVSKLFLDEITQQLAYLYAPSIRVNAIAPGAILPSAEESQDEFYDLSKTIPIEKIGAPRNIRHAMRFLIENDYVTGTIINVDGGWHL
jgi:NAD(P)-dependent dehydrogenase (short-subunit alcohol dehydrogenase family)